MALVGDVHCGVSIVYGDVYGGLPTGGLSGRTGQGCSRNSWCNGEGWRLGGRFIAFCMCGSLFFILEACGLW